MDAGEFIFLQLANFSKIEKNTRRFTGNAKTNRGMGYEVWSMGYDF